MTYICWLDLGVGAGAGGGTGSTRRMVGADVPLQMVQNLLQQGAYAPAGVGGGHGKRESEEPPAPCPQPLREAIIFYSFFFYSTLR